MYEVGQKLWFVPNKMYSFNNPCEVTITKIGKKFLYLSNAHKADICSLRVKSSDFLIGICYLSRESWEVSKELQKEWNSIVSDIKNRWSLPAGVTVERIIEARKLLGL